MSTNSLSTAETIYRPTRGTNERESRTSGATNYLAATLALLAAHRRTSERRRFLERARHVTAQGCLDAKEPLSGVEPARSGYRPVLHPMDGGVAEDGGLDPQRRSAAPVSTRALAHARFVFPGGSQRSRSPDTFPRPHRFRIGPEPRSVWLPFRSERMTTVSSRCALANAPPVFKAG